MEGSGGDVGGERSGGVGKKEEEERRPRPPLFIEGLVWGPRLPTGALAFGRVFSKAGLGPWSPVGLAKPPRVVPRVLNLPGIHVTVQ